jgi:hypothetical protein
MYKEVKMKKVLLVVMFAMLGIAVVGCSKDDNGNSEPNTIHNIVNGKQLYFTPVNNIEHISSDKDGIYFVVGKTYKLRAYVLVDDGNDQMVSDPTYDTTKTIWTISSNLGHNIFEEKQTGIGQEFTFVITGSAGSKGTIKLELDGMIFSFPVTIVSSIE